MARGSLDRQTNAIVLLSGTAIVTAIVAALYWAQVVFIPLALAVLLTFLLTPAVRFLERRGLGRVFAVVIVVLLSLAVVGNLAWLITRQTAGLAQELPDYSVNIQQKIQALQKVTGGWERLERFVGEIAETLKPGSTTDAGGPATVVVRPEAGWLSRWPTFVGSAVEMGAGAALAIVLTIFGLIRREDLRNRFLRLIGHRNLAYTTKAVDEAGDRVSRYLIAQAGVNAVYGLTFAVGLSIIGVKYAPLWGFLTAILRYVPYVGAWMSLMFPMTVSIATAQAWTEPIESLALFLGLEILAYNIVEPLVFKRSMGVSEVAQLVSAAFWAFLWGPVGLVLSAPLTVCLLVVGKYVPQFAFLEILLGDNPPLEPAVSLYQRLLAWDEDDASDLVASQSKSMTPEAIYDDLLLPALSLAKQDRLREEITSDDHQFILRAISDMVDDVEGEFPRPKVESDVPPTRLLACPSFDDTDVLALEMLKRSLRPHRWQVEVLPAEVLAAEIVDRAVEENLPVICIGAVPPGGVAHTRYLCKRLRARLPETKILVFRGGRKERVDSQQMIEAGADYVVDTVVGARNQLNAWLPVLAQPVESGSERTSDPPAANPPGQNAAALPLRRSTEHKEVHKEAQKAVAAV